MGLAAVVSVAAGAAWASCSVWATAAKGAKAMTAPRPIATNLFSIVVPLEASLPTLVSRTSSICACHDELEMNTELCGRGDSQRQYCRSGPDSMGDRQQCRPWAESEVRSVETVEYSMGP